MLSQAAHSRESFPAAVAAAWPQFRQALAAMARDASMAVIAGGYEPGGADRPFNTLLAVGADGAELGTYRKLHLYDAFAFRESDRITPGDGGIVAIEVEGLRLGLMTCYDVRFPELARAHAVAGVHGIALPAAWHAGEHKVEHWRTLVKARAVENTVWMLAADTRSSGTVGHSMIVDPLAVTVAELTCEAEGLVTAEVSVERVEQVREVVPCLANRRDDVFR